MTAQLEARNVCARRGKTRVLSAVSLRLLPGEMWGLLGPNGSGKSTLLEVLLGSLPVESGEVLLEGRALRSLSRPQRAQRIGLIGRELSRDVSLDVRSLVELGRLPHQTSWALTQADRRAVDDALRETGCLNLASRPLFALSDGERQRVQWARVLAQAPKVLLLDEATAHLDLAHRERTLLRTKKFCSEGGSALVVLHDLDLAVRHVSHVAVLNRGRLVAAGIPKRVLTRELLRDVFEVEAELETEKHGPTLRIHGVVSRGASQIPSRVPSQQVDP